MEYLPVCFWYIFQLLSFLCGCRGWSPSFTVSTWVSKHFRCPNRTSDFASSDSRSVSTRLADLDGRILGKCRQPLTCMQFRHYNNAQLDVIWRHVCCTDKYIQHVVWSQWQDHENPAHAKKIYKPSQHPDYLCLTICNCSLRRIART